MTDDEFLALYDALTEENKVIIVEMIDRLLTEQLLAETA